MSNEILIAFTEGVMTVRMDRPSKKNAITIEMYSLLADALEVAENDPAVRAVVLRGHQEVFTSGNDLSDFRNTPPSSAGEERPVWRFLRLLSTASKPVVAAVTGPAVGIGTTMLLHCDLIYAASTARLQLPFVNLALVPEAASTLLLPAALGHQRAAELLLLGESFSAQKALVYGVVTDVVADDADVFEIAMAAAKKLAAKPPAALRLTKLLLKQATADPIAQRMQLEGAHFDERLASAEVAEALAAFLEKRAPDFSNF
jgi:enoyl-CoA hydratase/carnithine racemase